MSSEIPGPARPALAGLCWSLLLASLGTSIANVGLPTLAQTFGASFAEVRWVVLAYLLATTGLVVAAGRLGDVFGRRRLLLAGIATFTIASVFCGAAPALGWLIAARALQGCAAALMMALPLAFVGETVPAEKTGSAMGLLGALSAVGTALGPSLGGALIAAFGWRAIFLVQAPLGLVALLYALRLPAGPAAPAGGRFFGGVVRLLRDRRLATGLATSLLVAAVLMATLVVGPFYLSRSLGLEAALVGLAMSAGPIVAALAGVPAGRLVDRFGARAATLGGLGGLAAGCAGLALSPSRLGAAGYLGPIVVATASYALFQAANNTAVLAGTDPDQRGTVSGLLNLSRNLGLIAGTWLLGAVFAWASEQAGADAAAPAAAAFGMRATFAIGAAAIGAAFALAASCCRSGRSSARRSDRPGEPAAAARSFSARRAGN